MHATAGKSVIQLIMCLTCLRACAGENLLYVIAQDTAGKNTLFQFLNRCPCASLCLCVCLELNILNSRTNVHSLNSHVNVCILSPLSHRLVRSLKLLM